MRTNILFTLDLFYRQTDPASAKSAEVWSACQPHVEAGSLGTYIPLTAGAGSGNNLRFCFAGGAADDGSSAECVAQPNAELVPIPLPDDLSLELRLIHYVSEKYKLSARDLQNGKLLVQRLRGEGGDSESLKALLVNVRTPLDAALAAIGSEEPNEAQISAILDLLNQIILGELPPALNPTTMESNGASDRGWMRATAELLKSNTKLPQMRARLLRLALGHQLGRCIKNELPADSFAVSISRKNRWKGILAAAPNVPYSEWYTKQLREKLMSGKTPAELVDPLRLTFWGGHFENIGKRNNPKITIPQGAFVYSQEPGNKESDLFTNIHCLTGLLLCLHQSSSELPFALKDVTGIELLVTGPKGTIIAVLASSKVDQHFSNYFRGLSGFNPAAVDSPSVSVLSSTDKHVVYYRYNPVALNESLVVPAQPSPAAGMPDRDALYYFCNDGQPQDLAELKSIELGLLHPQNLQQPIASAGSQTLTFTPCILVRAQLGPYLQQPPGADGLLRLQRLGPDSTAAQADSVALFGAAFAEKNLPRLLATNSQEPVPKPVYLQKHEFAWAQDEFGNSDPVHLYWGNYRGEVFILRELPTTIVTEIECTEVTVQPQKANKFDNVSAQRQLLISTRKMKISGAMTERFNALRLTTTQPLSGLQNDVVPLLIRKKDISFYAANSADRCECQIAVKVREASDSMTSEPAVKTVQSDYLSDLANYNSLQVFHNNKRILQTDRIMPFKHEIVEDSSNGNAKIVSHHFNVRCNFQPDKIIHSIDHYKNLYDNLRSGHKLTFRVEHTYGESLPGRLSNAPLSLSSAADFAPRLAVGLSRTKEKKSTAAEATQKQTEPFMWFQINTDQRELQVYLNATWLRFAPSSSEATTLTQSEQEALLAWQAVLEMGNAKQIVFGVTGYEMKPSADVPGTHRRSAWQLEARRFTEQNRTSEVVSRCQDLRSVVLEKSWNRLKPKQLLATLQLPADALKRYALLQCELKLVRQDWAHISTDSAKWLVQQLGPNASVPAAAVADVASAFRSFLSTLHEASGPLYAHAGDENRDRARELAHLTGQRSLAVEHCVWLPQESFDMPQLEAVLCPLTFVPLSQPLPFGDDTELLVRRYFGALQRMQDCEVRLTSKAEADDFLAALSSLNSEYAQTIDKLHECLVAIPADDPNLNSRVAALLKDAGTSNLAPYQAVRDSLLRDLLRRRIGTYDIAKAILLTCITGEHLESLLRIDAHLMARRQIEPATPRRKNRQGQLPALEDATQNHLHELRSYSKSGPITNLYLAEVLDDTQYDNAFAAKELYIQTSEGNRQNARPPTLRPASEISLQIPDFQSAQPAGLRARIRLASRATLRHPLHLFTGELHFENFINQQHQLELPHCQRIDYEKLLKGTLQQPANKDSRAATLVSTSPPQKIPAARDQIALGALFMIYGDEESAFGSNPSEAFTTDTFELGLLSVPVRAGTPPAEAMANSETFAKAGMVLRELRREKPITATQALALNAALPEFRALLKKSEPDMARRSQASPQVEPRQGFSVAADPGANCADGQAAFLISPLASPWRVFIFQPPNDAQSGKPAPGQFLMLVCAFADVWSPHAISLLQERNKASAPKSSSASNAAPESGKAGANFAKELQQSGQRVSASALFQAAVSVDASGRASKQTVMKLKRSPESLKCLINKLLYSQKSGGLLSCPSDMLSGFDLNITVYHEQCALDPYLAIKGIRGKSFEVSLFGKNSNDRSRFPLVFYHCPAHDPSASPSTSLDWFENDYRDFSLDFSWHRPDNNLQVFQLTNVRVQIV